MTEALEAARRIIEIEKDTKPKPEASTFTEMAVLTAHALVAATSEVERMREVARKAFAVCKPFGMDDEERAIYQEARREFAALSPPPKGDAT